MADHPEELAQQARVDVEERLDAELARKRDQEARPLYAAVMALAETFATANHRPPAVRIPFLAWNRFVGELPQEQIENIALDPGFQVPDRLELHTRTGRMLVWRGPPPERPPKVEVTP